MIGEGNLVIIFKCHIYIKVHYHHFPLLQGHCELVPVWHVNDTRAQKKFIELKHCANTLYSPLLHGTKEMFTKTSFIPVLFWFTSYNRTNSILCCESLNKRAIENKIVSFSLKQKIHQHRNICVYYIIFILVQLVIVI